MNLLLRVTVAEHQARDPESLDNYHVPLTNCRYVDRDEDPKAQVVLGTLRLCGVDHFAVLVRVHETKNGFQEPVCDPLKRLADFASASGVDGTHETIQVAGLPGEWVLHVHPYGR